MPRDASGSYTLPAGNPVVTGSIIQTSWANPTMDDIRTAMTDSLSRSGKGGMLAPFTVPDGSNINPSLSFVNEATSGLYRFGAGDIRMAVGTTDRMRWLGAGTPPQIYDSVNDRWNDLGAGGVEWTHAPVIPAEVEQGVGYMTNGGQSTNMPPSPITGQAVTFADLDNDWSATNFLTINGNGNTFTQGSQAAYELDLKGAYAQFAYLDGQWQIVNFGRLSDAYGFDLDDYIPNADMVGQVSAFATATAPTGWLRCDGAEVSRVTYARLYAVTGDLWGAGDGSTTFNLPPTRGVFIRDLDSGAGVDPARVLGTGQGFAIQDHTHGLGAKSVLVGVGGAGFATAVGTADPIGLSSGSVFGSANETRPTNLAMPHYIRY